MTYCLPTNISDRLWYSHSELSIKTALQKIIPNCFQWLNCSYNANDWQWGIAFQKGRGVQQKSFKIGACRTDRRMLNWFFFLTKIPLSELIFGPKEASWTGFWQFLGLGLGTKHLPNLGILNRKLGNCFFLGWNGGLVELKNAEKGVLWSGWESRKRGVFHTTHLRNPFQVKYPPAVTDSMKGEVFEWLVIMGLIMWRYRLSLQVQIHILHHNFQSQRALSASHLSSKLSKNRKNTTHIIRNPQKPI